jgi:hypothetical protein
MVSAGIRRSHFARRALRYGLNKILCAPADLGCHIVALPQVASRLDARYQSTKREHAPRIPKVIDDDKEIIDGLKANGVFVTSLENMRIPDTDCLLYQADTLGRQCQPFARSFQAGADAILAYPHIYRWGLHDRLLDIAENYLGVPVGYDGINVYFTKADGSETGARCWHRDSEDRQMLKIAVYLQDVDEGSGPFQVLRRRIDQFSPLKGGLFPVFSQRELEDALPDFDMARDVVSCVGKRGTVVISDTASLYHRGMPPITHDRYAIFFNYMSRVPLRPFRCERTTISRAQVSELARELPPRQRDCVLWRKALPLVARILPPAPTTGLI